MYPASLLFRSFGSFGSDPLYTRALFRCYALLLGGACLAWLLQPFVASLLTTAQSRLSTSGRRMAIAAALLALCLFLSSFLVIMGRHQFGAWDYNILIEVAWRQFLGQRPFVDFVTPTPPFFNWTAALAFRLFGVTWSANLYFSALFASATFLWLLLLFRKLGMQSVAAIGTSVTIQIAAMLTCCFWWYNNTTLIVATLFYVTSILLARRPTSRLAQVSYVLLLAMLPLTKPNIAGITFACCFVLLLLSSPQRVRVLLLTLGGILLCAAFVEMAHISILAMLTTYRGIAKERGGASTFGFQALSIGEQRLVWIIMPLLFLPLLSIVTPLAAELRRRRWREAAFWLLFPVSALVAVAGIAGNGELRDVECTLLFAALGALGFVFRADTTTWTRVIAALMCGIAACDLYIGAIRLRVYTIENHRFFEWRDGDHAFKSGFLKDVKASQMMADVDEQVGAAVQHNAGSVFFGPRLDFEYAAHRLPSPPHWPSFFQPGTSFDRRQMPSLVRAWKDQRFQTLVFLKNEYVFYPRSLMDEIETKYQRDDHHPYISVYRRRPGL